MHRERTGSRLETDTAEIAICTAILLEPALLNTDEIKSLDATDFVDERNRAIFLAIREKNTNDSAILIDTLKEQNYDLTAYLLELYENAFLGISASSYKDYIIALKQQSHKRRLLAASQKLAQIAKSSVLSAEEVERETEKAFLSITREKQKPAPLPIPSFEIPPFPLTVFPPFFASYVSDIAQTLSVPIDYPAVALLAETATLAGKQKIRIEEKDWETKANLYFAIVSPPGSGKTPAIEKTLASIFSIEEELQRKNVEAEKAYRVEQEEYEQALYAWKNEKRKGKEGERQEAPEKPKSQTIFTTDTTTESLAEQLSFNEGILLLKDELSSWINSMDQYRAGRGADREFYLSTWSGVFAKIDRKGKPPIMTKAPHLTVLGGIVPDKLKLLKNENDDGFSDRLLFSYPKPIQKIWDTKARDMKVCEEAREKLRSIYLSRKDTIVLDEAAKENFACYYEHWGNVDESDSESGRKAKMPQQVLRLALVLCLLYERRNCDAETITKAIELGKYFELHATKALDATRISKESKEQNAILAWAKRHKRSRITKRDLVMYRLCASAREASEKLHELVETECARWIDHEKEIELNAVEKC